MTDEAEILFEERGCAGMVTLNRPRALNALTLAMIRELHAKLIEWADDRDISRVVVRGAGGKAFCAGGDIRQIRAWGTARDPNALAFYREEYRLNGYIKRYPKPYVALVDGIVMGGGAGISVHGSHRICTERTMFAMPETGIGLFPDVGATYFLPRLPGSLGTYLALTGARLGQGDLLACGLATGAAASEYIPSLADDLADGADIDRILSRHTDEPEEAALARVMPVIDRCFGAGSVPEIVARLEQEAESAWAAGALQDIRSKCPISTLIAHRQMQLGAAADIEECLRIEFRIAIRVLKGPDFYEGVRAAIIDKDNRPQWSHASIDAVTPAEVDRYFEPLGAAELTFT